MLYALITEDKDRRTKRARVNSDQLLTWLKARELDPEPTDFVLVPVTLDEGEGAPA